MGIWLPRFYRNRRVGIGLPRLYRNLCVGVGLHRFYQNRCVAMGFQDSTEIAVWVWDFPDSKIIAVWVWDFLDSTEIAVWVWASQILQKSLCGYMLYRFYRNRGLGIGLPSPLGAPLDMESTFYLVGYKYITRPRNRRLHPAHSAHTSHHLDFTMGKVGGGDARGGDSSIKMSGCVCWGVGNVFILKDAFGKNTHIEGLTFFCILHAHIMV